MKDAFDILFKDIDKIFDKTWKEGEEELSDQLIAAIKKLPKRKRNKIYKWCKIRVKIKPIAIK